jgi:hypothetical protein
LVSSRGGCTECGGSQSPQTIVAEIAGLRIRVCATATHYTLAFRGTDDWQVDPIDDFLIFAGRVSAQMRQASLALKRTKRHLTG